MCASICYKPSGLAFIPGSNGNKSPTWNAARVLERLGEIAEAKQGDFDRPTAEWTDAMKRVGIELERPQLVRKFFLRRYVPSFKRGKQ